MLADEELFSRHKGEKVLLDSNILLLLLTGMSDTRLLGRFKRVSAFSEDDYELFLRFFAHFRVLLTTPHILTEVSNLANSLSGHSKVERFDVFSIFIRSENTPQSLDEHWMQASALAQTMNFSRLGITDAAICELSSHALVVTDDYRLSGVLGSKGADVLRFEDLRQLRRVVESTTE